MSASWHDERQQDWFFGGPLTQGGPCKSMHGLGKMKSMLSVCCFCDKVRDDTRSEAVQGLWQDLQIYMGLRKLRREDIVFAYTCCRDCMNDDPGATAFRARWSQSSVSILQNGSSSG